MGLGVCEYLFKFREISDHDYCRKPSKTGPIPYLHNEKKATKLVAAFLNELLYLDTFLIFADNHDVHGGIDIGVQMYINLMLTGAANRALRQANFTLLNFVTCCGDGVGDIGCSD